MIASATTIIGLAEEFESVLCCSKRNERHVSFEMRYSARPVLGNCPSHWQDRLTEKLKVLQQAKLKAAPPVCGPASPSHVPAKPGNSRKRCRKLTHSSLLSKLFITESIELSKSDEGIYAEPVPKSVVLQKHEAFAAEILKSFDASDSPPYSFSKTNLNAQMQYRMVSLANDQVFDHDEVGLRA